MSFWSFGRPATNPQSEHIEYMTTQFRQRLQAGADPASLLGVSVTSGVASLTTAGLSPHVTPNAPHPHVSTFTRLARRIHHEINGPHTPCTHHSIVLYAATLLKRGWVPNWVPQLRTIITAEAYALDCDDANLLLEIHLKTRNCDLLLIGHPTHAIQCFKDTPARVLWIPTSSPQ